MRYAGRMRRFIRKSAVFTATAIVVASGLLQGQSKDEFRRKYGGPVAEKFIVRPGISITATYGPNGRIAELLISPEPSGYLKSYSVRKPMNQDFVRGLIDELLPSSVRGEFVIAGFDNTDCPPEDDCRGTWDEYKKARVYFNAGRDGGINYAVVTFRK
jgi:hypothetical protein